MLEAASRLSGYPHDGYPIYDGTVGALTDVQFIKPPISFAEIEQRILATYSRPGRAMTEEERLADDAARRLSGRPSRAEEKAARFARMYGAGQGTKKR